ncbi:MAG: class I SAM-dependent methyltransferase, partial [Defluviitaleaceae bacterium]|nr:class I SAM-dependent methyltransferase [Defluviitaleaceae bacterium]
GTALTWRDKGLPAGAEITLTDYSPLMLEKAKAALGGDTRFSFAQVDIQAIPYADASFDMLIANHMLQHVPDMEKGLSEARRVLKPGGRFCATTAGADTMKELKDIYRRLEGESSFIYHENTAFTLENGAEILGRRFAKIRRRDYADSLEVTDIGDLADYIKSYNDVPESLESELTALLRVGFNENGVFHVTKKQGMFICE